MNMILVFRSSFSRFMKTITWGITGDVEALRNVHWRITGEFTEPFNDHRLPC